jgi:hypothetical protein
MNIAVACPYFFPLEKSATIGWAFPSRLPLGAGHCGTCRAAEQAITPSDDQIKDFCNLGYAACHRLPSERSADCVRFAMGRVEGDRMILQYVYERQHAPVKHGNLEYDCARGQWLAILDDECVQRQAECYLAVYMERRPKEAGPCSHKVRS